MEFSVRRVHNTDYVDVTANYLRAEIDIGFLNTSERYNFAEHLLSVVHDLVRKDFNSYEEFMNFVSENL